MAVRGFDGVDDYIEVAQPGDITGAVTIVVVSKRTSNTDYARVYAQSGSDGNEKFSFIFGGGGALALFTTGNYVESGLSQVAADGWCVSAVRHGGTQGTTPRMSISKDGGAFTHANAGSGASSSETQAGGRAFVGCDIGSSVLRDFNPAKYAAVFVFNGVILTDGQIEGLLAGSPAEYLSLTPTSGWIFNQDAVTDLVQDLTANNKDEIGRAGTTVVTGDDPPSDVFVFTATPAPPANISAPVASGVEVVNETLTTTHGTWSGYPAPSFTYQWQRDNEGGGSWSDIDDETGSTYVLAELDADCMVRCIVTATNTEGSASEPSNEAGLIDLPPQLNFSVRLTGGASNADPDASIGGAESSEELPEFPSSNALLRTITHDEAGTGVTYYRCVTAHNDEPSDDGTVKAYISVQVPGPAQIAVGVAVETWGVAPEEIADELTAPSGVSFSEAASAGAGVNMGTATAGDGRGLWVRVTIPSETAGDASNAWQVAFEVTPL